MGRNAGGEVTPTPKSFGGAPDSQAPRCGYLVLWSPETPCPPAPAGLCRLRSQDREASLLAGFLRGPGRCSWL